MHPKNTTAPPGAQHIPVELPTWNGGGFEYWEVQVRYETEGRKVIYPGVLDKDLAYEFQEMLRDEVQPGVVTIIWAAGVAPEYELFELRSDRMRDLIVSVRSAVRPGYEFLARLGQFGPYEGYATQNDESENVSRTSAEVRA